MKRAVDSRRETNLGNSRFMEMHLFLPVVIICLVIASRTNPICGNAELRALMEMKSSMDPQNNYLSSWTDAGDPCDGLFEGVACNEHRKVANISLQGKGLAGTVPAAVANLKCLSGLYLHYNSLSGGIPEEIANLTELADLYLDFNNLTGNLPPDIGSMANLQVLQLSYNQLTGIIPPSIGFLTKLTVLGLEHNKLTGQIPPSLGDIGMLSKLSLGSNQLSGTIPARIASIPSLEYLDVQNNTLSGVVPSGLLRIKESFRFDNNTGLCGTGFPSLRACSPWDNQNVPEDPSVHSNNTLMPQPSILPKERLPMSRNVPPAVIILVALAITTMLTTVVLISIFRYRRSQQKIGNRCGTLEDLLTLNPAKELNKRSTSPLTALEYSEEFYKRSPSPWGALNYSKGPDFMNAAQDSNVLWDNIPQGCKFNLEEIESATQHFSEMNLLGKSKFSSVYKGILKDGSMVAIKGINKMSCKVEEDEFLKGLNLLICLKNENLVRLKGFCCSKARGECFLIYEFAPNGSLSMYLVDHKDRSKVLNWTTRVSIVHGIAKGIEYLHRDEPDKPCIIHKNISAEKIVLDNHWKPLILDSGLLKFLADDVVFSAIKVSAGLGYMAPEYISTGRFTEKSDIYAFGVIILQVISGRKMLSNCIRHAAEDGKCEELIDPKLEGDICMSEVGLLTKLAVKCTSDLPENRPTIAAVVRELNQLSCG